jgi:hypothetical protein
MTVEEFLGCGIAYDFDGQILWAINSKGELQHLADLRAWGAIQNLFIDKKGQVDIRKAELFQDELGRHVASLLTKAMKEPAQEDQKILWDEARARCNSVVEGGLSSHDNNLLTVFMNFLQSKYLLTKK